ncbi:hypothetical protein O3G_MSEX003264 [Manduca sexta]|uniref:Uncharacterized protein n=1 Tax=Manduca sexta TaxID=7130 RepID=A0A921YRH7_MANSE|nr:hypothetical protein O3G_MSEX003264 [Manduca sexta]
MNNSFIYVRHFRNNNKLINLKRYSFNKIKRTNFYIWTYCNKVMVIVNEQRALVQTPNVLFCWHILVLTAVFKQRADLFTLQGIPLSFHLGTGRDVRICFCSRFVVFVYLLGFNSRLFYTVK